MSTSTPPGKVFVSYSWTDEGHKAWVRALAERLRADGVDVVLDRWDLREGHDKFAFMERMVADPAVTRVLAVCDRSYAEKADGRRGGVGTESQIISKEVSYRGIRRSCIAVGLPPRKCPRFSKPPIVPR